MSTPIDKTADGDTGNDGKEKNEIVWDFGVLTSKLLLEIVDFPLFTPNGEEIISLELVRSGFYLSPNQHKSVRLFHKFLFSNVLRMEGRGALATSYLASSATSAAKTIGAHNQHGVFVTILKANNTNSAEQSNYDFDWELMKKCETCNDKSFVKYPGYSRKAYDPARQDDEELEKEAVSLPEEIQVKTEGIIKI